MNRSRWMRWGLALLCLCLGLMWGVAGAESRLMVVTDVHYLAQPLYEGSDFFLRSLRAGDGKMAQEGETLMAALVAEALHQQPDALLLTGDLTFNGERESHEALAAWLRQIEAAGIPVWVIPGNHDINTAMPLRYKANGWSVIEGVDPAAFAEIYADFLLPPEREDIGFSYRVPVGEELSLVLLDVSRYLPQAETGGTFTQAQEAWVPQALAEAKKEGRRVITASHHSLLAHSAYAVEYYVMQRSEALLPLLRAAKVPLHLSGHLHIQHILSQDGVTDAALQAYSMSPHRYAMVTLGEDGELRYEATSLCAEHLPEGFLERSRDWFWQIARDKAYASLAEEPGLTEAEKGAMADFTADFNYAYFSGTYELEGSAWTDHPGYALWQAQETPAGRYRRMALAEEAGDMLHWRSGEETD